jgi:phosphatidylserine/phosphatidylglycerophosphate/cardiolipin synthase-like enzyme
MKKLISTLFALLAVLATPAFAVQMDITCHADVEFSPNGGGEALVVQAINSAQHQILLQAYNFTDPAIQNALVLAKTQRNVDVRLILDKSNEELRYATAVEQLAKYGIPIATDYSVAIAHNKVIIIDGTDLITGSYNYTVSAQHRNAENVIWFTRCPIIAQPYIQNWNNRLAVSRPYTPKQQ